MPTEILPPGPALPPALQAAHAIVSPQRGMKSLRDRYGDAFTVHLPLFGRTVVLSDPDEVKQLFQTKPDRAENMEPNLGRLLGPGSMFALTGDRHRRERKLLVPPFHGRRLAAYEGIVEEETRRELAAWPEGTSFATLSSWMRITLNIILRAVFGAEGAELERLRDRIPRLVTLGSRLAVLPVPEVDLGWWSPWGRFTIMRDEFDAIVERLIAKAERGGDLDERTDVLSLMLQARYEDGSAMTHGEIADELLTLLAAGHETTATTLAWAVERIRRHPALLGELTAEVDAGGHALRDATITEVQRTRPVIDLVGRTVEVDGLDIGRWRLPRKQLVLASIALLHRDESVFPDARRFDPYRFVDSRPDLYQWIPFGGGTRRCIGAAFATMEMNVALRTMLRHFSLLPTTEPGERWRSRGVANAPARGGRALVRRRADAPALSGTATGSRAAA